MTIRSGGVCGKLESRGPLSGGNMILLWLRRPGRKNVPGLPALSIGQWKFKNPDLHIHFLFLKMGWHPPSTRLCRLDTGSEFAALLFYCRIFLLRAPRTLGRGSLPRVKWWLPTTQTKKAYIYQFQQYLVLTMSGGRWMVKGCQTLSGTSAFQQSHLGEPKPALWCHFKNEVRSPMQKGEPSQLRRSLHGNLGWSG